MRRLLGSIVLCCSISLLAGCSLFGVRTTGTGLTTVNPQTTTEVPYSETAFEVSTYATGVSFKAYTYNEAYRLPDVYIDVTFTDVAYNPFDEEICLTFDVDDPSRAHASYYAILQDRASMQTRVQQQFFGNGTSHFSSGACFDLADSTLDYRIVIGKYDTDNPNQHYDYIEGSAWLEWTDRHIAERHTIAGIVRHDRTPETVDSLTASLISYSLVVDDPDAVIDSLTVEIRDAFDNLVDSAVIDSGSIRSGTDLDVDGTFGGLAPNASYVVYVYASGNDGVDDFTDIFLTKIELCSARFSRQGEYDDTLSYDGLYAVIYDVVWTSTDATVSYVYENDHVIEYTGSDEDLELHLELWDTLGHMLGSYPLETGNHEIVLPLDLVGPDFHFTISDQRSSGMYDKYYFPSLRPDLFCRKLDDHNYTILFWVDYGNVVDVEVEFYVDGFSAMIESITVPDVYDDPTFAVYHHFDESIPVRILVRITYTAYGKEYTAEFGQ